MQVVLLATGETEKLRPLTEIIPSPMIPVLNRPVMAYNLELLGRLGFKHILVSLHTQADSIEAYFGNGRRWGLSLEYLLQRDPQGSAGSLRWAKRLLNETFIVFPADEIVDLEISQAIQQHKDRQAAATVIVHPSPKGEPRALYLDENRRVRSMEVDPESQLAWSDTGVYVFEPCVLDLIPPRLPFEIHTQLLPDLLASGTAVWACPAPGYWNPLDTFKRYQEAQTKFLFMALNGEAVPWEKTNFRYTSAENRLIDRGVWVGRNSTVHPTVKLNPPVIIGPNSWIGREVELGPKAVIGADVMIDDEATVSNSAILDRTYVGKLMNIENRLVCQDLLVDLSTEENLFLADPLMLGKTDPKWLVARLERVQDLILSIILLIITLPMTLILAILLFLSTGRILQQIPILRNHTDSFDDRSEGRPIFHLLRFNTNKMDGRASWLGRWLERWEIDRLPELLNVAKGDLGMIGVRPLSPGEAGLIRESWQQKWNEGQAGFSGMWYIHPGCDNSLDETLVTDAYYVVTRSWRGDLGLLWQTPAAWYRRVLSKSVKRFEAAEGEFDGGKVPVR